MRSSNPRRVQDGVTRRGLRIASTRKTNNFRGLLPFRLRHLHPSGTHRHRPTRDTSNSRRKGRPNRKTRRFREPTHRTKGPLHRPPNQLLRKRKGGGRRRGRQRNGGRVRRTRRRNVRPTSNVAKGRSMHRTGRRKGTHNSRTRRRKGTTTMRSAHRRVPPGLIHTRPVPPKETFHGPKRVLRVEVQRPQRREPRGANHHGRHRHRRKGRNYPITKGARGNILPRKKTLFLQPIPSSFSRSSFLGLKLATVYAESAPELTTAVEVPWGEAEP